jgi:glycosyltransferase involved in cell wall biosynthesis
MRLGIVMPLGTQTGGAEQVLLDFLEHGQNQGLSYLVVFLERGPMLDRVGRLGADVRVVDAGRLRELHRYLVTVARLRRLFAAEDLGFVLSWMEKGHLYASFAATAAGLESAFHLPGFASRWKLMDRVAKALPGKGVITVSNATQRSIEQIWPEKTVRIARPGVDLAKFDRDALPPASECRRRLGLPLEGPLVGTIVRLQRWKGAHVLIKAMPRVLEAHPATHCAIIGGAHALEKDYEPYLHQLVAELGLERAVHFYGFQADLPVWRKAFDVDVYASDREPFAVGIVEALAMGNVVIGGDGGGTPEIIDDDVNGLLVPYGQERPLGDAITRALSSPELRSRLGAAARDSVQGLSADAYARSMARAVLELASRAARSGPSRRC